MIWQLAFCLICSTVLVAPFLPALIEWREKTDAAPLRVVREQDIPAVVVVPNAPQ